MLAVAVLPAASVALTTMALLPADRGIEAVQGAVPLAGLKLPPLFCHWTEATTKLSEEVPARASGVALVEKFAPQLVVIETAGLMVSRMTVIDTVVVLVAPSVAMMSMVLVVVGKAA